MITAVLITRDKDYPKQILDTFGDFFDEVIIKTECPNVYTRYTEAQKAKNDIIYVQDDDCLIDFKKVYEKFDGNLTAGITAHHERFYHGSGVTLVGWGCFFKKPALKNIDKYIERYGKDEHLLREADRIFTYLNQPHNLVIMDHTDFRPQVSRMWQEINHWDSMREAIKKVSLL